MLAKGLVLLNCFSSIFGKLAGIKRPRWLVQCAINTYSAWYGVRLDEAVRPIAEYDTLADFFVRDLKPGLRPMPAALNECVVCPVDGTLREQGFIRQGRALQVKGLSYEIADLLGSAEDASAFEGGSFWNFYLSPADYHQVHCPASGNIVESRHIPGNLWPVNGLFVRWKKGLFVSNERLVTCIEVNRGIVALVMVGAFNVGSMSVRYDAWTTNRPGCSSSETHHYAAPIPVKVGDRLGCFHMGSAVVLLSSKGVCQAQELDALPQKVQYGLELGRLSPENTQER